MLEQWIKENVTLEDDETVAVVNTDNPNMNLLIYMSCLYYDIYNNGGINVSDSKKYQKEIAAVTSIVKKFRISKAIIDHAYLEECTNMVFQYLQDKDLSFEVLQNCWILTMME